MRVANTGISSGMSGSSYAGLLIGDEFEALFVPVRDSVLATEPREQSTVDPVHTQPAGHDESMAPPAGEPLVIGCKCCNGGLVGASVKSANVDCALCCDAAH